MSINNNQSKIVKEEVKIGEDVNVKITPITLKGFRDFLPAEKRARDYVAKKIIETFELFGFEPIETPTLEYASLLTGKYGDEADKLVYTFEDKGKRQVGLRYDQTVPTARVLSQYQNELPKFFRRYQIQNVFRADKPQRGRYRELIQCDADIFNASEPIADAEVMTVFFSIFRNLGFTDNIILVNDRRSLISTIKPFETELISVNSIIQSIDKLDKLSAEEVSKELVNKGMSEKESVTVIQSVQQTKLPDSLSTIIESAINLGIPKNSIQFSPTLARGLDYYTGLIFEGIIPSYPFGSVGGGGRYDKLVEQLGGPNSPAVGFGLGFDRTVEAAQALNLIPNTQSSSQLLITLFDSSTLPYSLKVASQMRQKGIRTEVYPAQDKLPKQFKYADKKGIPYVAILGPEEAEKNMVTIKNMSTGEQVTGSVEEVIRVIVGH